MASSTFTVVAGVGPGLGASIARKFAKGGYPVVLMARSAAKYDTIEKEINEQGGQALGISADVTNVNSLKAAFAEIDQKFPGASCSAAVFNASGGFIRKPLLELTEEEFGSGFEISAKGAFRFSQKILPYMLKGAESGQHPPTLIFTGATAAIKANPQMATFASSSWARRAFAMSIAKEFAPQGVHIAHAVIDGPIDLPGANDYRAKMPTEAKINPDDIAETYWNLHTQTKRCFTFEVEIRTAQEKW